MLEPNVARPTDLWHKGTLLLAHLREVRLGIFSIAAMIACSPSMFPRWQMRLLARLST